MNRAQLWNELKNIVTRKNIKNNLQWKYATKKLI